jgi:hypothetical protein
MAIIIEEGESSTNRKIQYLVYFISEVLSDLSIRYFHIMKLAYALLITSCKLSTTFRHIRFKFTLHQCLERY